jgi:phosphatidate cytidylyltransferase
MPVIHDPFVDPQFLQTALRIAIVLLLLIGVAIWRGHRVTGQGRKSLMLVKVLTALWVAPILLASLFSGEIFFIAIVLAILIESLREYVALVALGTWYAVVLLLCSLAALAAAFAGFGQLLLVSPVVVFLGVTLVPIISGQVTDAHRNVGGVIFGYLYISIPLSLSAYVRESSRWGLQFLILASTAIAFADAGASVIGSWVKGPKLAPRVSPAKTWSGFGGAFVGAGIAMALLWNIAPAHWTTAAALPFAAASAVGAVWGDLVESFVKRDFAVKDAGSILPGFGGIMDRFDSFFVGIPAAYAVFLLIS